ncbi:unnamed protein product [Cochlearia groenlandica]
MLRPSNKYLALNLIIARPRMSLPCSWSSLVLMEWFVLVIARDIAEPHDDDDDDDDDDGLASCRGLTE